MALDRLAVADLTAPALHLLPVHEYMSHGPSVEVLEVYSGSPGAGRPQVAGPSQQPLRPFEDQQDLRAVRSKSGEAHGAIHISLRVGGVPHDARVGYLLDDRRVPRLSGPQQLRRPTRRPMWARSGVSTRLKLG
jgi:hypothetical protein